MTICIKVNRRKYNEIKKIVKFDENYIPFFEGDYAYIPVKKKLGNFEVVECNPPRKIKTPKLRDLIGNVSSFYIIGDIAIVSPKSNVDINKLSESIMKINKRVKSVFLKRRVSGEFRINELIHIGGIFKTSTIYKENGILFYVDIAKVYINPSMGSERKKISKELSNYRIVLDAFTGYGAIALNVAKENYCYIIAGDINTDGLLMLKKSINMNKNKIKGFIDIINYDAHYLPFREKVFDIAIGDNPTMIREFIKELCRVSKQVIIYILESSDNIRNFGESNWIKVNEYSKNLFIFKGKIACNNISK
jgi:tRNA wybutosine-synthesizing protein 2